MIGLLTTRDIAVDLHVVRLVIVGDNRNIQVREDERHALEIIGSQWRGERGRERDRACLEGEDGLGGCVGERLLGCCLRAGQAHPRVCRTIDPNQTGPSFRIAVPEGRRLLVQVAPIPAVAAGWQPDAEVRGADCQRDCWRTCRGEGRGSTGHGGEERERQTSEEALHDGRLGTHRVSGCRASSTRVEAGHGAILWTIASFQLGAGTA